MELRRIGVFTSGGDAPGMNACVRAVVRTAYTFDLDVIGIRRGYEGMIEGDFVEMDPQSVSNILQKGGTLLKSARSERFRTPEGRARAAEQLRKFGIDGLVGIGGDGTLRGAAIFYEEHGIPIVGCPGTIDNDLFGTDETIGYDTALNTAIENIDRIRDTADAHNRLFLVEVMGRDAGFIALNSGIGGGAELVLIPETFTEMDKVKKRIHSLMSAQSRSSIVVVAEGDELGGAAKIANALRADPRFERIDLRVCILGHTQRGGAPTARDRVLASRLGAAAVEALVEGHTNVMVGIINNEIKLTPTRNVWQRKKTINYELLKLTDLLS
ncbi:6-phosphofructokinase [Rhodocaloribacter litoris]|uniref:6-phosphofructokinase n=1 Tax=Rhodocaloribacter litoris TaxID=2558931 RepID=UPI0014225255|nr:6-phosphofructokinase [Rhodocaloribacter litoris]QXD16690.1 6-phosphofructokinase [Rhodocaloribacter litoris]